MDGFTVFNVVKNSEGIYSIFPTELPLPCGWEVIENARSKEECLQRIKELWVDSEFDYSRDESS